MKLHKTILPVLVLAGLGGCAVYPVPGSDGYGYGGGPYASEPPVTVYGGSSISYSNSYGYPVPVPVYPHRYYDGRPPPPRPYFGGHPRPPEVHRPRPPEAHRPPPRPRPDAGPGAGPRPPHPGHPRPRRNENNRDHDGNGVPDSMERNLNGDGVGSRFERRPGSLR